MTNEFHAVKHEGLTLGYRITSARGEFHVELAVHTNGGWVLRKSVTRQSADEANAAVNRWLDRETALQSEW